MSGEERAVKLNKGLGGGGVEEERGNKRSISRGSEWK